VPPLPLIFPLTLVLPLSRPLLLHLGRPRDAQAEQASEYRGPHPVRHLRAGTGGHSRPPEGAPPRRSSQERGDTHCKQPTPLLQKEDTTPIDSSLFRMTAVFLKFPGFNFHLLVGLRVVPEQPDPAPYIPSLRAYRGHLRSRDVS
jgi:hypothetical protein